MPTPTYLNGPTYLKGLADIPDKLWVWGTFPPERGVAIVGTRRCTSYGQRVAKELGRAVALAGWPVVSGLARGVDGAAHRGVAGSGRPGWAVLGSGIDVIYPSEHATLATALIEHGGGLISEYPPGTPPAPFRFPARNRIIAALAEAVVVVEAKVTGGALITARLALELGREVLAVPGDIDRPTSEGCNLLIRDGAHPVLGGDDLIATLEMIMGPGPVKPALDRGPSPTERGSIDEILARSERPAGEVLAALMLQELEGPPGMNGANVEHA
ncbi:MAG: DNA-processing protein DprA [Actinomycetota bacterium]